MVSQTNFFVQFHFGKGIALLIFLFFITQIAFVHPFVFAGSVDHSAIGYIPNYPPIISAVTINNGSAITLTPNATTTIRVNFSVNDTSGCSDVFLGGNVTSTLYRSGVGGSCIESDENCYIVSTTTYSCVGSSTSANATSTFDIYYFAQATDASSSFPSENWLAFIEARDASSSINTTNSVSGVELNTLLAINVLPTSTNYGNILTGSDTGATNTIEAVYNVGNASATLNISGTAMASGTVAYLPTSSQRYATSSFTFGGNEQLLNQVAQAVQGFLVKGTGPIIHAWTSTTPLPGANASQGSFAYNGYVYNIGGASNTTGTPNVLFAPINSTGSIGSWTATTPLPTSTYRQGSFAYNGYVYNIGGFSGAATATVLFAPINSTGSIGSWTATTPLPTSTYSSGSFTYNGYVYNIGGFTGGSVSTSSVYFAPINSTGSIGTWISTTPLPYIINSHGSFAHNGYVYNIGGTDSGNYTSTVLFAPINSTGSIGAWTSTTPLPGASSLQGSFAYNGYVYNIGGFGTNATSTVLIAPLYSSGFIGRWLRILSFPTSTRSQGSFVYNGYAYSIGGVAGTSATSTVRFTQLNAQVLYWGIGIHATATAATYSGTVTYTATFSP